VQEFVKEKAVLPFIVCGHPQIEVTEQVLFLFQKVGVDAVELGIPFTDPIGDGVTIQKATERALKCGITLKSVIKFCKKMREKGLKLPLILLSYYNPIYKYGVQEFVKDANRAGVDGVIVPDLPPEEAQDLMDSARREDFCTIFLVSPTTSLERASFICKRSEPFIYYVSLKGVTGAREHLFFEEVERHINGIKSLVRTPICIGFGISNAEQARRMAHISDGVIIGSRIVQFLQEQRGEELLSSLQEFLEDVMNNVKSL
jgi:tryptophan synthase alpha chain